MLGAIAGDIIGSIYEHANIRTKAFPLFGRGVTFTDDSVCTIAIAEALMDRADLAERLRAYVRRYPGRGYGLMFQDWALDARMAAYNSWGNGAAMRVSAIAHLATDEAEALALAAASAAVSHDHPDGIAAAQATVLAGWRARQGATAAAIRGVIATRFGYDLSQSVDQIRTWYQFDISAKGTVPPALVCALEARDFEDAIRNAVSIGGDTDTVACITGGIAEIIWGVPDHIATAARAYLDDHLRAVVDRFDRHVKASHACG